MWHTPPTAVHCEIKTRGGWRACQVQMQVLQAAAGRHFQGSCLANQPVAAAACAYACAQHSQVTESHSPAGSCTITGVPPCPAHLQPHEHRVPGEQLGGHDVVEADEAHLGGSVHRRRR